MVIFGCYLDLKSKRSLGNLGNKWKAYVIMNLNNSFASRMSRIGTESAFEVLAKARALEAKGAKVIHLEIGQPDFPTPPHIVEAAIKALRDGHTGYGPSSGLEVLREAISRYVKRHYELDYNYQNQIAVFPGAKPGVFMSGLALIEPGDEVVIPDPAYPIYASMVQFLGGKPVPLVLEEERDFRFSPDSFADTLSNKTKMVILNTPHNPTGSILTREDTKVIRDHAEDQDFIVLTDEVYSRITYSGKHVSVAQLPGMQERTILVDGFSKTYSMTGWRLGWTCAPAAITEKLVKLQINITSCPTTFSQIAAVQALDGPQDAPAEMVKAFEERRNTFVKGLNAIDGITCRNPGGAFYVFPNITGTGMRANDLQSLLLNEAHVACLSGEGFGNQGKGHLRFSYAASLANIKEALQRIETTLQKRK